MVNPDVNGYAKKANHRKILREQQTKNILKAKRILKPKYKLRGGPVGLPDGRYFTANLAEAGKKPVSENQCLKPAF